MNIVTVVSGSLPISDVRYIEKYRFRDNFAYIVIVSISYTALADFDIYQNGNILR